MTEFTLVLPLLILILSAILDFGLAFSQYLTLQTAVQESLSQAEIGASDSQIVSTFTTNLKGPLTAGASVTVSPGAPRYPGSGVTVTGNYTYRPVLLEIVGIDTIPMQYSLTGDVQ